MKLEQIRKVAMALPEVTEAPHHNFGSFRVAGKIFITMPPDGEFVHVFVGEEDRETILALYPEWAEKLMWGKRALGLRIALRKADAKVVLPLVRKAWGHRAPARLVGGSAKGG